MCTCKNSKEKKEALTLSKTILYILNPEKYFKGVIRLIKKDTKNKNIVYVTTNKPYDHITNVFKKARINSDNFFFIDCISKHIGKDIEKEPKNCVYIDGPQNLTTLSVAINESLKHFAKEKILILDSLSTLLIYHDSRTIGRFSNFFINKMRSADVDTIILALESDIDKDIIKQIESFVDEVKKYG